MSRITYVCAHCGSDDVMRDAYAVWDTENQEWALCNVFDQAYCHDCDRETSLTEEEAPAATMAEVEARKESS